MARRIPTADSHHSSRDWLPAGVEMSPPAVRSTSLERDSARDDLSGFVLTGRAHEFLSRFTAACADSSRARAWSLTGPYGTGKSSLALLLDALCGPDDARRGSALGVITARDKALADTLRLSKAHGGFTRAVVTARRESLTVTVQRALHSGVKRRWPTRQPDSVAIAMKRLASEDVTPSSDVLSAVEAIALRGSLLIIIDEFGKTLEHFGRQALDDHDDDLYLLQELAELGAGRDGLPVYLITLQHASFLDYAMQASGLRRREWAKVQGRFEDVAFLPDIADAVQLIGNCVTAPMIDAIANDALRSFGVAACQRWSDHGLDSILTASPELLTALYPLHPLTAAATPLLAAALGQHDRTLTSFLTADEPHSAARWVSEQNRDAKPDSRLALVRLPQLYDYFLGSGRTNALAASASHRWLEIETRLSEAHGLPEADQRILKTVGILNIIDAGGALRASADLVGYALDGTPPTGADSVHRRLRALEKQGFVAYRSFADEYRIWQGTDVDIQASIDDIARRLCDEDIVAMIAKRFAAGAIVAGRHSQTTGMLRHFNTTVTTNSTTVTGAQIAGAADGTLIYHLGHDTELPDVASPLPVLIGLSNRRDDVLVAARRLAALEELLDDQTLDAVARREVAERIGQARSQLSTTITTAFTPSASDVRWLLRTQAESTPAPFPQGARSLAALVSVVCDQVYPQTPHIRNEMLGRHQLTSQGAKARRNTLHALITAGHKEALGFTDGWGPERAMYHGVIEHLGLHTQRDDGDNPTYELTEPGSDATTLPTWQALQAALTSAKEQVSVADLFTLLSAPPYGLKAGVTPILVTAALVLYSEDIALFEEGSYVSRLTPEHIERVVAAPTRFSVKYVAVRGGQRHAVLENLCRKMWPHLLDLPRRAGVRNPALVAVTNAILDDIRGLSPYAMRTRNLPPSAQQLRDILIDAQEPDTLLFRQIPQVLGLSPVSRTSSVNPQAAQAYAKALDTALTTLRQTELSLREQLVVALGDAFLLPRDLTTLRHDLVARARPLVGAAIPQELRCLVEHIGRVHLDDDDWLNPLVLQLAGRGIDDFHDETVEEFCIRARAVARSFDRVTNLYFHAARDGEGFDARQVTLTGSDGYEQSLVVHVPADLDVRAKRLVETVKELAAESLGQGGGLILLAALARNLIDQRVPAAEGRSELRATEQSSRKKIAQ